ncbi:MAG: replication-associated recombination protein A [Candidatus Latescibacteria bacterium]|jgi:putative ATPase|nr:replication-associated recombination protein A [Candidatus Latescibacterota bacterium]
MTEEMDLFGEQLKEEETQSLKRQPLADRFRPRTLEEFVGQEHLVGEGAFLNEMILKDEISSIIFWGPPGSGKTTLARIISNSTNAEFASFSAVVSGVKDIREVVAQAKVRRRKTILFVDEIHRFNKAQQDAFLPVIEDGTIILIGATTENPSFEVNSPLLSRSRVLVLNPLTDKQIAAIARSALEDSDRGLGSSVAGIDDDALDALVSFSGGDARRTLNTLEIASTLVKTGGKAIITLSDVEKASQKRMLRYDRAGEEHFNIISAIHKSMRGSDPDAALYWFCRMLEGGEDPLYIARRVVRFATEDIGNADPQALVVAMAATESYRFLGSPEGELAIAQAIVYCATAPKSNSMYTAYSDSRKDARKYGELPVPMHIRNAPTSLMKDLGYSRGYEYDHNSENHYSGQEHLPEKLIGQKYYLPTQYGFEKIITERIKWWAEKKKKKSKK